MEYFFYFFWETYDELHNFVVGKQGQVCDWGGQTMTTETAYLSFAAGPN